jgi:4-hydroxy-tetrahydrodipicolinate reductase
MGKEIEKIAIFRKHEIIIRIDPLLGENFNSHLFPLSDIAIEFTNPESALHNCIQCFNHSIPVVSGTTGWQNDLDEVIKECKQKKQTFFYAPNFSIGVNIFFELNEFLAQLMNNFPEYEVGITETHHIHKKDAPSGTAITLAEGMIKNINRKKKWELNEFSASENIGIKSIRKGEVTGIHSIKYESFTDEIEIRHTAKSRTGLAIGAVLAAEFAVNKKGFLTMKDLLKDVFINTESKQLIVNH